jgi:hypothetical protein
LQAVAQEPLDSMLRKSGGFAVAKYRTQRTKFSLDDFSIDVDEANYGYSLVEVELLCNAAEEIPAAKAR